MYCWKCGKQIPDDAAFCMHCGTAVKKAAAQPAQRIADRREQKPASPPMRPAAQTVQKPASQPIQAGEIPLPTGPVPVKPPDPKLTFGMILGRLIYLAITAGLGVAGIYMLTSGIWVGGVICWFFAVCFATSWRQNMLPDGQKALELRRKPEGVEVGWIGKIGPFAIAIDGSWAITGAGGDKILLPDSLIARHAAIKPEEFNIVLALITDTGVKYCGDDFYMAKKK